LRNIALFLLTELYSREHVILPLKKHNNYKRSLRVFKAHVRAMVLLWALGPYSRWEIQAFLCLEYRRIKTKKI